MARLAHQLVAPGAREWRLGWLRTATAGEKVEDRLHVDTIEVLLSSNTNPAVNGTELVARELATLAQLDVGRVDDFVAGHEPSGTQLGPIQRIRNGWLAVGARAGVVGVSGGMLALGLGIVQAVAYWDFDLLTHSIFVARDPVELAAFGAFVGGAWETPIRVCGPSYSRREEFERLTSADRPAIAG